MEKTSASILLLLVLLGFQGSTHRAAKDEDEVKLQPATENTPKPGQPALSDKEVAAAEAEAKKAQKPPPKKRNPSPKRVPKHTAADKRKVKAAAKADAEERQRVAAQAAATAQEEPEAVATAQAQEPESPEAEAAAEDEAEAKTDADVQADPTVGTRADGVPVAQGAAATEARVPTWLTYTGGKKYTYGVAKKFCADEGGELCTKEQYCPRGQGEPLSESILGFPYGQTIGKHKWAPHSDKENGWIHTSTDGHPLCMEHQTLPDWGGNDSESGSSYGSTMCCFMPQDKLDIVPANKAFVVARPRESCTEFDNHEDLDQKTCADACRSLGMKGTYLEDRWDFSPRCFVTAHGNGSYGNCHWNTWRVEKTARGAFPHAVHRAVCKSKAATNRTVCPKSHPFAYHLNYSHCCKANKEKVHAPQGMACDGSAINAGGVTSMCCNKDDYVPCAAPPCSSYQNAQVHRFTPSSNELVPTWVTYTGSGEYTYGAAKSFCADHAGELCTKEQYCPNGVNGVLSQDILGWSGEQTSGDKWAPFGVYNDWVQTGRTGPHRQCMEHPKNNRSGGAILGSQYGTTMCCAVPQATTTYTQVVAGYSGYSYREVGAGYRACTPLLRIHIAPSDSPLPNSTGNMTLNAIQACADACSRQHEPAEGSWTDFGTADGFSFGHTNTVGAGDCYCTKATCILKHTDWYGHGSFDDNFASFALGEAPGAAVAPPAAPTQPDKAAPRKVSIDPHVANPGVPAPAGGAAFLKAADSAATSQEPASTADTPEAEAGKEPKNTAMRTMPLAGLLSIVAITL